MKGKFFDIKAEVWNQTPIFQPYKAYMVYFKNTKNPKRKHKIH